MSPSDQRGSLDPENDVVIVTGASRGIGFEICRRFGELGASVGMIARDPTTLEEARRRLPGSTCAESADVARPSELERALSRIESSLGDVSVLVNNAGHGHWGAVVDTDPTVFERTIAANYLGAVRATGHVLPGMLRRGHGHIVNVASIAGRIGAPFEAAYSASKFALVGYSESLAVELAGSGVSVSLVDPGPVDTEFFERRGHPYGKRRPRPISAGRVADAVVAAVRRDRREQFLPRWLRFAYVAKTVVPVAHGLGARRMFASERRALQRRYR